MLTVDFDLLGLKEGELFLDAGCGEGRHTKEGIRRGASCFATDLDIVPLKRAHISIEESYNSIKKYYSRGNNHPCSFLVHQGNACSLPYRDKTFHRIICSEVMEHVPDDFNACKEMVRVLKKGGTIAFTVPTMPSELLYKILTWEYFATPGGHIRIYTPQKLRDLISSCGLEIYAIDHKHALHTIWWAIRSIVGLHREKQFLTKKYHNFLSMGLFSPGMRYFESLLDWIFPKSMVIYAKKL